MEEYRNIAKKIFIPSFFTLLVSASVVFLFYSFLYYSIAYKITGIALLIFFYFANYFNARKTPFFFSRMIFPVLIALLIFVRILSLNNNSSISEKQAYTGVVKSVLFGRYSKEVIIGIENMESRKFIFLPDYNKAASYISNDIGINPGDELEITAKPEEIRKQSGNLRPFEIYLLQRGIHYILHLNDNNFRFAKKTSASYKNKIRKSIEDNLWKLFDKKTVPLLKGLYFANSNFIDKKTALDFKRAGVLHILAASGEHVGIIAGVLLFIFSLFLINRKTLHLIIAAVLLFYLYITDMPVSLVRAFIMYYIFTFQYFLDRDRNIFNVLFISGIIILIINPFELYSLGFQLSFGATFGIITFYKFYKNALSSLPSIVSKPMAVTCSAQTIVLPVILIQLNEINLAGFASNVVLVSAMTVTLISSIFANLVSLISPFLAGGIAFVTDISYTFSLSLIKFFSELRGHFVLESKNMLLLLPYFLFLLPALPVLKNRKLLFASIPVSIICAWFILSGNNSYDRNKLMILNNSILVRIQEKSEPVVFGYLDNRKDAELLVSVINRYNIRNINLYIPKPDFNNLKHYSYLVKKTIVNKCYLSNDFFFTMYFKNFCKLIDMDNIKLKIADFNNNNKGMAQVVYKSEKLKESSIDNIAALYNILTMEYNLKPLVIEDIAGRGISIEYVNE